MRILFMIILALAANAMASPEADWEGVLALENGPSKQPASVREAKLLALEHLAKQRQALKGFLDKYPQVDKTIDARIRLASLQATSGKIDEKQSLIDEAMRQFQAIERDTAIPLEKRAEAGFRRVCLLLQSLDGMEDLRRGDFVNAAKNFEIRYPRDSRVPRLLVEVATICDEDPSLKRELLERADSYPGNKSLKARIADDLKRLDLLGKPLDIRFSLLGGGEFNVVAMRGKVGVLVFWSAESMPSILWMRNFRRALSKMPSRKIAIATMALDAESGPVVEAISSLGINSWVNGFDGQGWGSPVARTCGINALPTVFLLDQRGILRSINARYSYASMINTLIVSPPR
jgi:hypothetical protein